MPRDQLPTDEIWEDLCTRFILNVPNHETETFDRLLFVIEQAHWYYEDVLVDNDPNLKSLSLRDFIALTFQKCPGLEQYQDLTSEIYKEWQQYKQAVPVNGAIILEPTLEKCLLVKGWNKGAGWGFPRGKITKNEKDVDCAIREVKEETGFDISKLIAPDQFIEVTLGTQRCRLFVIPGVPESTSFAPLARKEISALAWHRLSELPATKEEANQVYMTQQGDRHRFFMVWPYVKKLRKWIKHYKRSVAKQPKTDVEGGIGAAPAMNGGRKASGGANKNTAATEPHEQAEAVQSEPAGNSAAPVAVSAGQPTREVAKQANGSSTPQPKANGKRGANASTQQTKLPQAVPSRSVGPCVYSPNGMAGGLNSMPGKAFMNFKFDRRAIMQRLKFDA